MPPAKKHTSAELLLGLTAARLKEIATELGQPTTGTKDQVVARLLDKKPFKKIINDHLIVEDLKEILRALDLKVGGNRDELKERLLAEVPKFG